MTDDERYDLMPPLSPPAAAEWLTMRGHKTTARTIQRLIMSGDLAAMRTPGGQARIKRSVLQQYIRDQK